MDLKSFREDKLKIKSQSAFADLIGVELSDISKWENNPESISWQIIQRIIEKTGVSIDELTGWQKPMPKPLDVKDTWMNTDHTKRTLFEYISDVFEKLDITDEYRKSYIDDLRHGIAANLVKPKVAIVGRSDTGKSTLINALLGTDKMPTSWTPTTSVAVYIKHISDKPAFITEDAWVFTSQVGTESLWDERKLYDEDYCRSWKIGAGGIEILRSFGTRQGENYDKEAGAAVIFIDSPILKTCDIVDLPGFGTETESDDNITFAVAQKADVVIYLSQANGFMRIEDITYLKRNISELPVWENKRENSLKPLSNLFIVASQAHAVNCGNRDELEKILDSGCERFLKTLPDDYWAKRKNLTGFAYENNGYRELRSRYFAYTIDIPDICVPFNTALKEILESLPGIINQRATAFVRSYIESRKPALNYELHKYEGIIAEREKYVTLLREIEKNEFSRIQDNNKRKDEIREEIDRLHKNSKDEFSNYYAETINTDKLADLIKEKKIQNKKDDVELFGSLLQSMVQEHCEKILTQYSEELSEKTKEYIASYKQSIINPFEDCDINIDFDPGWIFASALSALSTLGGLGTLISSLVHGLIWIAGTGLGMGAGISLGLAITPVIGPIGIVVGLLIAGGLGFVKLFGGGWEKNVAKKIVVAFEKNNVGEKFREGIKQYWEQTVTAFEQAATKLDVEWECYVENLRSTIDDYDIETIRQKVTTLRCLSDLFENIPL